MQENSTNVKSFIFFFTLPSTLLKPIFRNITSNHKNVLISIELFVWHFHEIYLTQFQLTNKLSLDNARIYFRNLLFAPFCFPRYIGVLIPIYSKHLSFSEVYMVSLV
jgi:hypothetical protein